MKINNKTFTASWFSDIVIIMTDTTYTRILLFVCGLYVHNIIYVFPFRNGTRNAIVRILRRTHTLHRGYETKKKNYSRYLCFTVGVHVHVVYIVYTACVQNICSSSWSRSNRVPYRFRSYDDHSPTNRQCPTRNVISTGRQGATRGQQDSRTTTILSRSDFSYLLILLSLVEHILRFFTDDKYSLFSNTQASVVHDSLFKLLID